MKKYIYCYFLTVLSLTCYAQQSDSTAKLKQPFFKRITFDASNTGLTIIKTYARPFHWKKQDWMKFGGVLVISAGASFLDDPMYKYFRDHPTGPMDEFASVGDFLGQPEHNYPFMLAVWGSGVIINNDWLRDTGVMLFASVTTSGLIQTGLKELTGRARPSTGEGPHSFDPFSGPSYHSFPSGHTMLALASAWILAHQVNFMPLKIAFYALPIVTGISRVYVGAHWFSDILLGSALGIACAETVLRLYPKIKRNKNAALSFGPTSSGLGLVYKFK
ncbi:phosphatase PAP2 family protein [Fulvivirga sediminis]|uniref:Phosphatase PAP2 family protein n=1 Tax=Fulvivirga sediminis TaxID=2803949 RepID=A0A937F9F2_9BACT|nr:phosphatase PAP2 family protein [Fulvivirga sediminis]MBL3656443.1 phosphatase PAP2 family protein [Fulvivirga sediminis]